MHCPPPIWSSLNKSGRRQADSNASPSKHVGGRELLTACRLLGSALEKLKREGETSPGRNQGESCPPFDWSQPTVLAVATSYLRIITERKTGVPRTRPIPRRTLIVTAFLLLLWLFSLLAACGVSHVTERSALAAETHVHILVREKTKQRHFKTPK